MKYLPNPPIFLIYLTTTNNKETDRYMESLKSASPGVDSLSSMIIKHSSTYLFPPLRRTFNLFLKIRVLPDNRLDINNYHPISILPAFRKILEKIIAQRLKKTSELDNLLANNQHGLQAVRSAESPLLQFVSDVYKLLNEGFYVVWLFLDLSKVFDSLNHQILLNKLEHIDIKRLTITTVSLLSKYHIMICLL